MNYIGGKANVWGDMSTIVLEHVDDVNTYIEPFVGGMNCISKVPSTLERIGSDIDPFVIHLFEGLARGLKLPERLIDYDTYDTYRSFSNYVFKVGNKPAYKEIRSRIKHECLFEYSNRGFCMGAEDHYVAVNMFYIAVARFLMSYRRKPFAGWVGKYTKRDYYSEAARDIHKTFFSADSFGTIQLYHRDYTSYSYYLLMASLEGKKCIVYCDPPQQNATRNCETLEFDYTLFWNCMRNWSLYGHYVYISAIEAPEDFVCVWESEKTVRLQNAKEKAVVKERLFKYKGL